ncbi:alpha/beta hydrolase [Methylobacterium sp. NEAU 140]|uniref:alpha/beta fold hydrolase n=1 Tax=Methylobacterium sp. NEAU 140 TaxID=3064945 RepID=UPI0027371259|nr:alpha/beta hydrolase [Methylobacterium sp. NEAU 140]MDP4024773.1 alpha/beta hydrolase [Methylobacterium sp. NEAU 140]
MGRSDGVGGKPPLLTLRDTPGNPVPTGGTLVAVGTADDCTLRAAYWRSTARTGRGTVCLLQGRAEFIEKYYETVRELRARGFDVVAFDWRGQGESDRRIDDPHKGHVARFDEYRLDLRAVAETVLVPLMPEPHYGLAHSMGGCVALTCALGGWIPFRRLVTVAPMLSIRMVRWPAGAALLARVLQRLGFGDRYVPFGGPVSIATKPFSGNRLSLDPARYARNAAAAQQVGAGAVGDPTIAWLAEAFRAMGRLRDPRAAPRITLPTLVVAAGADPVCGTPATERFAARLKAGHILVLPDARHEILTERDAIRQDFWAAFDGFVPGSPLPTHAEAEAHAAPVPVA